MDKFFKEKSEEVIKYRFENPQKAFEICRDILKHGAEHNDWYEVAYAQLYMGDTLFSMGKINEAIDHMLLGEKIQKKYGYDDLLMKNYNITAIIYTTQGDDFLALDYLYYAIELAKKFKNYIMLGVLYNNIGAMLHNRGDAVSAAEYFEKGIEISKKEGSVDKDIVYDERQFYINICGKYIEEEKYSEAKEYLDKAMNGYANKYSSVSEARVLSAYALIYYKLGEEEKSYEICNKVLHMEQAAFDEVESFEAFLDIVLIFIKTEHYEDARQLLLKLDEASEKTKILKCQLRICCTWIEYYEATRNKKLLHVYYKKYFEIKQKLNRELNEAIITAIDNRRKLEDEREFNEQLNENSRELVKESETDELTGINNRYGLRRHFEKLFEKAVVHNDRICMAIFDIDYFKVYNDKYGHLYGDECLKKIAHIIKTTANDDYFVARYGGDEFLIMGMGKTDEEIEQFSDKLFMNIKEANISFADHPDSDRVTISLGAVNSFAEKESDIFDFIHSADNVLYKVKEQGKNNYLIASVK